MSYPAARQEAEGVVPQAESSFRFLRVSMLGGKSTPGSGLLDLFGHLVHFLGAVRHKLRLIRQKDV